MSEIMRLNAREVLWIVDLAMDRLDEKIDSEADYEPEDIEAMQAKMDRMRFIENEAARIVATA